MSRIGLIVRNPKMALGALATVGVAASLTVGSGAFVADQEASEANAVKAGTADVHVFGSNRPVVDGNNCRDTKDAFVDAAGADAECLTGGINYDRAKGSATFQVKNLSPGQPTISRCFVVGSSSDVPVGIRLDVDSYGTDAADNDLAKAVNLRITRDGSQNTTSFGDFTAVKGKFGVVAQGTLLDLKKADAVIADYTYMKAGERRALENDEAIRYCVEVSLTNEAEDQQSIEGKTVSFAINALGQSIYGTDLDGERPNNAKAAA